MEDLLQGDPQFVDDGWVLLPTLLPPEPHVPIPRKPVQVETGEGAKGVAPVHLHVFVVSSVGLASKEDVEGVRSPEESGKGGVRVPVEGVGEGAALSFTTGSTSSFETS